mgnify:FL=1
MQAAGDPFIVDYWLKNYERVWADDVDELHVHFNGQTDPELVAFIKDRVTALGGRFTTEPGRLIHGQATRKLVEACTADAVLLIEDDAFIREPGAVAAQFARLEAGEADVFATPRGGMDPAIFEYACEKWANEDLTSPEGNYGPGLWPCFVFARLADLMATSRRFESWAWSPGQTIPGLEYTVPASGSAMCTDSFTTTAFELRGAGLRIGPIVQYKELWNQDLPPEGAPWFHAGGLANGDFLKDVWDGGGARADIGGTNEGLDWAHRVWWWRRIVDSAGDTLAHLQPTYRKNLARLVDLTGVGDQVEEWTETLLPWISWDDSGD